MNTLRFLALVALTALAGCAYMPLGEAQHVSSQPPAQNSPQYAARQQARTQPAFKRQPGDIDPKTQPYSVMGKTYWPIQSGLGYREDGVASWYGMDFHGKKTATGETYDMFSVSAAHKTLPLGTKVRVTNLDNGRELELVVNDRGPFVDGRIIDLSYASARLLGMADHGVARVRVEGIADNPLIASGRYKGVAVASADAPPRKPKAAFVERNLDDEPVRAQASKQNQRKAPALAAKSDPAPTAVKQMAERQPARQVVEGQDASGRYSVQVGAFSHDDNARRVKERLVQSGFRGATVTRAVRGGRELSVVQAGSFSAREQAEEALRSLREEFPSSFINTGA